MFKEITETRRGLRMKCTRKTCGYEWDYFGQSEMYVSCPRCRTMITLHPKRRTDRK